MKIRIAAALAAGLAALTLAPAAAHADPHHHQDAIRYASVKGCPAKDGQPKPCGPWRLVMHNGEKRLLRDAQTVARNADGTSTIYQAAPIAVSGNGRRVAYFTKSGRLAVRTLDGGVRLLAANALPKVSQADVSLMLSDDGARLGAVITGKKTRIFDTATGAQLGAAAKGENMLGFSADGDELLTSVDGDESVTDLAAYRDTGEQLRRVSPPQLVSANGPQALAADGKTVANIVFGRKTELVTYDMEADQVTGRTRIKLPAGDLHKIDWTGENQVTLHLGAYPEDKPTRMTIVQIDVPSGTVKIRDRYDVLADSYVFAACGG